MVCLGLKPGDAGWKAQVNPLSFGGTLFFSFNQVSSFVQKELHCVVRDYPNGSPQIPESPVPERDFSPETCPKMDPLLSYLHRRFCTVT